MCDLSSNIKKHMIDAFGEKRHRLQLKIRRINPKLSPVKPFYPDFTQKGKLFNVKEI